MTWRFTLTDYSINPSGVTSILQHEPNGWAKGKITTKRDRKTHGMIFDFSSNSLGFHGEGYDIIYTAYQAKGVNANTEILIQVACNDTYEELYTGKLLYPKANFTRGDDCYVEIPVEQTGCQQTLVNRLEQNVEIEATETFDGTALSSYNTLIENLSLVSKPIFLYNNAEMVDYSIDYTLRTNWGSGSGSSCWMIVSLEFINVIRNEFYSFYVTENRENEFNTSNTVIYFFNGHLGTFEHNPSDFECVTNSLTFHIILEGSCTLSASFEVENPSPYTLSISLVHTDSSGAILGLHTIQGGMDDDIQNAFPTPVSKSISADVTIVVNSVAATDKFFVCFILQKAQSTVSVFNPVFTADFTYGSLEIKSETQCDETNAKVFLINETISRVSEIITDDCLKVYSEYFGRTDSQPYSFGSDGCGSMEVLTNGSLIRRATQTDGSDPKFFISMKKIIDGLFPIHNLGMGIEQYMGSDVLRVESMEHFYQFSLLMTLTNPKEVTIEIDEKSTLAQIKVGYKKWESEYNGGLDEFLSNREYRTETSSTSNSLNIESEFIASGYAIEVIRRVGNTTEDHPNDNEIFIICVEREAGYSSGEYKVETFDSISTSNILSSTNLYNVRITPVRNLMRWWKTIVTSFTKEWGDLGLKFVSGTGNYIAEINPGETDCFIDTAGVVAENEDVYDGSITTASATPIFEAEILSCKYPLSWQQWLLIKANPYKIIKVERNAEVYYGFINKIEYEPNLGEADFELLVAYDASSRI